MCLAPVPLYSITHDPSYRGVWVPCGKCPECLYGRYKEWITRLQLQAEGSACSVFFTLTYDDANLPSAGVSRPDVDMFLKNIRSVLTDNKHSKVNYKYYLISEYGDLLQRPHYHGLLFFDNFYLTDDIRKFIYDSWKLGHVDVSDVLPQRIAYVAQYHSRLSNSNVPSGMNSNFRLYSKGLGRKRFREVVRDLYNVQSSVYRSVDGFRTVPRNWRGYLSEDTKNKMKRFALSQPSKTSNNYSNFINRFKKKH